MPEITPQNIGESLKGLRIADYYTSLLHVSGSDIGVNANNDLYTGSGRVTGLSVSSTGDRVVINRYIEPVGFSYPSQWLDAFFPMNSVLLTVTNNNPSDRIAGTKWCLEGNGGFMVGVGNGQDVNDPPHDYTFSPGSGGVQSGDRAGEYCVTLNERELPGHSHTINPAQVIERKFDPQATFCFYFGDTVNPQGLSREQIMSSQSDLVGNFANESFPYLLEQDRIEAFQNNTSYTFPDGRVQEEYRTWLIEERHRNDYRYTDQDFAPKIANYPLEGWGGSVVGGPGWGGLLTITKEGRTVEQFINNSPRPANVPFTATGEASPRPVNVPEMIRASNYDPRDDDRVHPGTFGVKDLMRARNIIFDVLGAEEATKALEGVNMLTEQNFGEDFGGFTTLEQIEAEGVTRTTTAQGATDCHNNILPNYGVYIWRRVPLDYECPVGEIPATDCEPGFQKNEAGECVPIEVPETGVWRAHIKQSYKNLNLRQWALQARDANGRRWNGEEKAIILVEGQKYLWSDDTSKPGLTIDGAWPNGLELINHGKIMGRGGDGGSYGDTRHRSKPKPPGGGYFSGWNGGDAIKIQTTSSITINNKNAIGGGGGGGAAGTTGDFGGGGGGAGGGKGGNGSRGGSSSSYERGGDGGNIGRKGKNGQNSVVSSNGKRLYGDGGEAGGGGSGGYKRSGNDPHGGGGGGGRILRDQGLTSDGGRGGESGGGDGGSNGNNGENVSSREGSRWGNAGGGGGWGANGGKNTSSIRDGLSNGGHNPRGGRGGAAIRYVGSTNVRYMQSGNAVIYGDR